MPGAEVGRIYATALLDGKLADDDAQYVSRLVARHTGLSQAEAEQRVNDTFARMQARATQAETQLREAADTARKATSRAALWFFVALLVGAFTASLSATFGGRQRDRF
jgi:hypothetical protein